MTKLAINLHMVWPLRLSPEAVRLGRHLSGDNTWGGPCFPGDVLDDGKVLECRKECYANIPRHDPALVQVVEWLGRNATTSSHSGQLWIEDVPSGTRYTIIEDRESGLSEFTKEDELEWHVVP